MSAGSIELPEPDDTFEISPGEVAMWHRLPREERPRLIDCREEDELAICRIDGCEWIPLGAFNLANGELTANAERGVVVYCHHGMRSLRGASILRLLGVRKAFSMNGGIDAWSRLIDPDTPRY